MVYTMTVYTATNVSFNKTKPLKRKSKLVHSRYCYILLGLTGVQYNGNQNLGVQNTQYKSTR